MQTTLAFVFALALLIAVHEWGHFRMARACGVKVLRFSIGFGPVLMSRKGQDGTEFTLCLLPLGGYVRMLDQSEGQVPSQERHRAFDVQPLRKRAAIVAAGPLANLVLAVLLYAAVSWIGLPQARPILSAPLSGSLADQAGLRSGMLVQQLALDGADERSASEVSSFEQLRWELSAAALSGQDATLWASARGEVDPQPYRLALSGLGKVELDASLFQQIGLVAPWSDPVMGQVLAGGAAARAGLQAGDRVLRVDGRVIEDGQQLRRLIRDSLDASGAGLARSWQVLRSGQLLELEVRPDPQGEGGRKVGRIAAFVGATPETVIVRQGFFGGLAQGFRQTLEVASLTLDMMGRMLVGLASLENLSGPLAIADQAGKSASQGGVTYLAFLALISVSLGVLNLLPLPVLDGGHLLYYLVEALTGRPVSGPWLEWLQRAGMAILLALMCVAIFNDIARLTG